MTEIKGLEKYKPSEIKNIVLSHIDYLKEYFCLEGLDFSIKDVILFGSRITGCPSKKSDLDVKIRYTGDAREDNLFNALNDKKINFKIEDIKIDFYPEKI